VLYQALPSFSVTRSQKKIIVGFSFLYIVNLLFLYSELNLPDAYVMVTLIPLLTCASLLQTIDADIRRAFIQVIFAVVLFLGVIFPLLRFVSILPNSDGHYQKSMVYLMDNLLSDGGNYIAGVPLLRNIEQPVPGLIHLVGPSIDYIAHPSKKLYPLMTPTPMCLSASRIMGCSTSSTDATRSSFEYLMMSS